MSDPGYLHEFEDVWLTSESLRPCGELWSTLARLNFHLDDDVFTSDRPGRIPLWQTRSIAAVHVLRGDEEIFDEEAQWDRVKLRYLLATLPPETVDAFVEKAGSVAEALCLPMQYCGQVVTKEQLATALRCSQEELRESLGEPGSKEVAAAIEMTYPRRR